MDTSQNKDIGMRQSLLGVAGKNTIPPQHIIRQQRRLSQSEFESQTRKIIPLEHRELCPLCHCPSFIFLQSKYITKPNHSHNKNISQFHPSIPGTFMCETCSNKAIQFKLLQINKLKQEIKQLSNLIQPILFKKLNHKNSNYFDNKLKSKQYQQTITNLRHLIQQKQNNNKLLKTKCDTLQMENNKRRTNLQRIESKLKKKWEHTLSEHKKKYELYINKQKMNENISQQISLNKLFQITDFYKMKVLPTMHMNNRDNKRDHHNRDNIQLSMIQNIAIPSIFKIKHIKTFYRNPQNELFKYPLPHKQSLHITIPSNNNNNTYSMPYYNKSHSLINYKSSQYEIPLKASTKSAKIKVKINKHNTSPLQKYMPRITNSISSYLTPPGYHRTQSKIKTNENESKSLPKNLDDLILPPTFFNDDHEEKNNKNNKNNPKAMNKKRVRQLSDGNNRNISEHKQQIIKVSQKTNVTVNKSTKLKLTDRGRSHSLDALQMKNQNKKISLQALHEPHIEHGICAALQYIVSYVLHASKYLNIELLYPMGLYKKNKRGKFILHTYIQRKGKYFRLYWINTVQNEEFEVGLHLLQQNINDLSIKCGVKSSKLKYLQFIANLNTLINHLERQENMHNSNKNEQNIKNKKIKSRKSVIRKQKIEPLHIINNYGSQTSQTSQTHLIRERSTSNSVSRSFSESTTAINNSESDVVISPQEGDSEHEDWDFVDYN